LDVLSIIVILKDAPLFRQQELAYPLNKGQTRDKSKKQPQKTLIYQRFNKKNLDSWGDETRLEGGY